MRLRSFIPLTILAAIGCSPGSDSPFGPSQSGAERQNRQPPVAQKARPADAPALAAAKAPSAELARRLASGSNSFGFDLFAHLRTTAGNLAFSPASLSLGLLLPWGGARGETDTAFRNVLHLDGSAGELLPAWGQLVTAL